MCWQNGVARRWQRPFPLATFITNISGAFALGFLYPVSLAHIHTSALAALRVVLGTGFLGGYTTFSTLSLDTTMLTRKGRMFSAALNTLGTLVVSVLAVAAGVALGNSH